MKLDKTKDYGQLVPPQNGASFVQGNPPRYFDHHGAEVDAPESAPPSDDAPNAARAADGPSGSKPTRDELDQLHTNKLKVLVAKAGGDWTDRETAIAFLSAPAETNSETEE